MTTKHNTSLYFTHLNKAMFPLSVIKLTEGFCINTKNDLPIQLVDTKTMNPTIYTSKDDAEFMIKILTKYHK